MSLLPAAFILLMLSLSVVLPMGHVALISALHRRWGHWQAHGVGLGTAVGLWLLSLIWLSSPSLSLVAELGKPVLGFYATLTTVVALSSRSRPALVWAHSGATTLLVAASILMWLLDFAGSWARIMS